MPQSHPDNKPFVLNEILGSKDKARILDLGIGYGNYGHAIKQLLPDVKLTGVEGFEQYKTDKWISYSEIWIEEIEENVHKYKGFDIVLLCDVLEHFEKPFGLKLLDVLVANNKKLIVSCPEGEYIAGIHRGNLRARHLATWTAAELKDLGARILHVGVCVVAVFG